MLETAKPVLHTVFIISEDTVYNGIFGSDGGKGCEICSRTCQTPDPLLSSPYLLTTGQKPTRCVWDGEIHLVQSWIEPLSAA
jgi:hypothetical protein